MPADAAHTATGTRHDPATLGWMLPLIVAGGVLIAAAKLFAGPLTVPLLSMLLLGAGFSVAAALLVMGSRLGQGRNPAWMAAGALVFLGFAAALLSDGPEALAQIERMQTHSIAAAGN